MLTRACDASSEAKQRAGTDSRCEALPVTTLCAWQGCTATTYLQLHSRSRIIRIVRAKFGSTMYIRGHREIPLTLGNKCKGREGVSYCNVVRSLGGFSLGQKNDVISDMRFGGDLKGFSGSGIRNSEGSRQYSQCFSCLNVKKPQLARCIRAQGGGCVVRTPYMRN